MPVQKPDALQVLIASGRVELPGAAPDTLCSYNDLSEDRTFGPPAGRNATP